jgi:DNA helicase-2/ATP-dependent DNA helicase PcrA
VTPEQILDGLDEQQRQAVTCLSGPLRIIAGAGTGKTRTVAHRIAYACATRAVAPGRILAVTHSQKAAGELQDRLARLEVNGPTVSTFHSAAWRQVRHFWQAAGRGGEPPTLLQDRFPAVRRATRDVLALVPESRRPALTPDLIRAVGEEIAWARTQLCGPDTYDAAADAAGRLRPLPGRGVSSVFRAYEDLKTGRGLVDFDDVLTLATDLIDGDDSVAAQVRAAACHFVVDEFQDTDRLQARLLQAWLGDRDDLCVVGDPRQAIYGFKGGDSRLLTGFTRRFPHARTVSLVNDYRSTRPVVELANRIAANDAPLVSMAGAGPQPWWHGAASEEAEVSAVVTQIGRMAAAGADLSQIAVLYRSNFQATRWEQALREAGIDYRTGDVGRLFDHPEVKVILRRFGDLARRNPDDTGMRLFRAVMHEHGWFPDAAPERPGPGRDRWEMLAFLAWLVGQVPGAETLAARYLLADLQVRVRDQRMPGPAAVTLTTVHAAKGLEWEAVFVTGLNEGVFPAAGSRTAGRVGEERRLLYVAVTRARRYLHLSWAGTRDGRPARPSRFVTELGHGSDGSRG